MKICIRLISSLIFIFLFTQCNKKQISGDSVIVDYGMAEKTIEWLEFVKKTQDDELIKESFMENVAPTAGCQSIIHHWSRFMEWDNDIFYKFIMVALNRIPTDAPLKNEDGSLTGLGRRRMLWLSALENTAMLRDDIELLKRANLTDTSLAIAKKYLPDEAVVNNKFYIVLFGASNAFAVNDENGYDLLQLPKQNNGMIDVEDVIGTFAHEMHHTGFVYCVNKYMKDLENSDKIFPISVLAAEGMPTHFINRTRENLDYYLNSQDKLFQLEASDWQTHLSNLPRLYREAEQDISLNIKSETTKDSIWSKWMGGIKGPAYVLGDDMFLVIEKYLGVDAAIQVLYDYRQFLNIYNDAATKANESGENYFIFNKELVEEVSKFTG